jgi:hypothetical protein
MKIEVITTWYNDAFLAPFFLRHYSYADHIRVMVDADTEDREECKAIVRQYPNASIEYFKFPDGYNVVFFQGVIFSACNGSTADWVIVPDSDEFIFCEDMHKFLASQTADIVKVKLYQVFRNVMDADLDSSKPIMGQRMHGDPNYVKGQNSHGTKPIILRTGKRIHLTPGNHWVWNIRRFVTSNDILIGQHWQMADPCFCITRRMSRKKRLNSAISLPGGYAAHDLHVTEEYILSECNAHLNDGELPGYQLARGTSIWVVRKEV